jgi:hypothetical protein
MSISVFQILTVGQATLHTLVAFKRSACSGWRSRSVATLREAETILKTIRFNVVLCAEKLADGMGYELAPILMRQRGTLYVGVALSETRLWLPVVERGVWSLGDRAMNSALLETEVSEVLGRVQDRTACAAEGAIFKELQVELEAETVGVQVLAEDSALDFDAQLVPFGLPGVATRQVLLRDGGRLLRMAPKTPVPSRRKSLECGVAGGTFLQAINGHDAKTPTGTHGRDWRG